MCLFAGGSHQQLPRAITEENEVAKKNEASFENRRLTRLIEVEYVLNINFSNYFWIFKGSRQTAGKKLKKEQTMDFGQKGKATKTGKVRISYSDRFFFNFLKHKFF